MTARGSRRRGAEGRDVGGIEVDGESTSFEPARVRVRRGSRWSVLLWGLALAGIVGAGIAGQLHVGSPSSSSVPGLRAALPTLVPPTAAAVATGTPSLAPYRSPVVPPVVSSAPGLVHLEATRQTASVFVHGDVYARDVVWVFVSVLDDAGDVAGWASVSLPGAAGAPPASAPALRFDVEIAIPEAQRSGRLSVQANAYDALGRITAGGVVLPDPSS